VHPEPAAPANPGKFNNTLNLRNAQGKVARADEPGAIAVCPGFRHRDGSTRNTVAHSSASDCRTGWYLRQSTSGSSASMAPVGDAERPAANP